MNALRDYTLVSSMPIVTICMYVTYTMVCCKPTYHGDGEICILGNYQALKMKGMLSLCPINGSLRIDSYLFRNKFTTFLIVKFF